MTTKHISKNQVLEMFIENYLDTVLVESLPEAIETVVSQMPVEHQEKAFKDVQEMKDNPQSTLAQLSELENETDFAAEIDYESGSYEYFTKIFNDIVAFFSRYETKVIEIYQQEYAKKGINLIVN